MADITVPLRAEEVIDPKTGNITLRYAEYFEELTGTVNDTSTEIEAVEGALSEVQQTTAFTSVLSQDIEALDQLTVMVHRANAQIAVLSQRIDDLEQLLNDS